MKRFLPLLVFAIACAGKTEVVLHEYYFLGKADEPTAASENPRVLAAVSQLILAIISHDELKILQLVDPNEGAIIDAKAAVSYERVALALKDRTSQLARVLWDDQYWQNVSPNDNIHSYERIFSSAGKIKIRLYYYSASECEVRMDFKGRPSMGVMGNAIFRKRGTNWYLANFF